jgi:hypothetical protein
LSIQIDKLVGPLIVAGVVAIVGILWTISLQIRDMQAEIKANRSVTCTFARKLDIIVAGCEVRP